MSNPRMRVLFILVSILAEVLSLHRDVACEVGIKMRIQSCVITGSCFNIRFDTKHFYCELVLEENPSNNTDIIKLQSTILKRRLTHKCGVHHGLIASRTKGSRCVPVQKRKEMQRNATENFTVGQCISGSCHCNLDNRDNPNMKLCAKECKRYGIQMTVYKGYSLTAHNEVIFRGLTMKECETKCITHKNFTCMSFEYGKMHYVFPYLCHLSAKGYFDVPKEKRERNKKRWVLGVRDCED